MKFLKFFEEKHTLTLSISSIIAITISVLSIIPFKQGGQGGTNYLSYIYHFSVFFLLSFFMLLAFVRNKEIKIKYIFIPIFFSIIYSILSEVNQLFVPFRQFSPEDILTNTFGIFSSTIFYLSQKL